MKKLWITMVVVLIVGILVFIVLGKVNDSSLSATSQAIEKIQHNTETSDNLIEELLKSERHFVEASFITVSIIITFVIILFSVSNFKISKDMLETIKKEIEYKEEFKKLRTDYDERFDKRDEEFNHLKSLIWMTSADGFRILALALEDQGLFKNALILFERTLSFQIMCPIENKIVQKAIMATLNQMYRVAKDPKVTLPDEAKKKIKDTLDKLSEHPFLKDKAEAIKEALKIDS